MGGQQTKAVLAGAIAGAAVLAADALGPTGGSDALADEAEFCPYAPFQQTGDGAQRFVAPDIEKGRVNAFFLII
ncbi:MAG: hypothetical protein AAFV51_11150 [Pseudomonadota bacterium]